MRICSTLGSAPCRTSTRRCSGECWDGAPPASPTRQAGKQRARDCADGGCTHSRDAPAVRMLATPSRSPSTCGHTESSSSSCSAECWPLGLAAIENCQLRCGLLAAFGAVKTPRGPHCDWAGDRSVAGSIAACRGEPAPPADQGEGTTSSKRRLMCGSVLHFFSQSEQMNTLNS